MSRGNNNNIGRLVHDAHQKEVDDGLFLQSAQYQWNDFYPGAEYFLTTKMPRPIVFPVNIRTYVDANHAVNFATWRSHIGILNNLDNLQIILFSERQNTVESSSFGLGFLSLRIVM